MVDEKKLLNYKILDDIALDVILFLTNIQEIRALVAKKERGDKKKLSYQQLFIIMSDGRILKQYIV